MSRAEAAGGVSLQKSPAPSRRSDGKGKGPLSSTLKAKPADLTTFAKKNGGVFPLSAVYEAVDGRNATGSHATHEMPIWGLSTHALAHFADKDGQAEGVQAA